MRELPALFPNLLPFPSPLRNEFPNKERRNMCHVVLFAIPFLALPVFWILPLPQAIAVYAAILSVSTLLFWKIIQALSPRDYGERSSFRRTGEGA